MSKKVLKNYKISIITVTKNSQKYLKKNIMSVYSQNYKNYEHIIIDGKSTDQTVDIIKKNKKKIAYFESSKDRGIYDAMNKGIKKCKGDIIGSYLEYQKHGHEKFKQKCSEAADTFWQKIKEKL